MAALFNGSFNNHDNIINYISECKAMGVKVLPPDVNLSSKIFTVEPTEFRISDITLAHFERDFSSRKLLGDTFHQDWLEPLRKSLKRLKNRDFKDETEFLKIIVKTTEAENEHNQVSLNGWRQNGRCRGYLLTGSVRGAARIRPVESIYGASGFSSFAVL